MGAGLIVGGDGQLGTGLGSRLRSLGWKVLSTTRRPAPGSGPVLDLGADFGAFFADSRVESILREPHPCAFLLAARTGFAACEREPVESRRVNVERTVALGTALAERGAFVIFPSSNAVFGDGGEGALEDAVRAPSSEYGHQKADAEAALLEITQAAGRSSGAAVLRLSKVVGDRGLVADWLSALSQGRAVDAATDLVLSPLSGIAAAEGMAIVANARRDGVYHLSGAEALTYFEFARKLARRLGAAESLVRGRCVRPPGTGGPSNSGMLGMGAASLATGLRAQSLDSAIDDVIEEFGRGH